MEDTNRSLEEQIRNLCDRTSDSMDRRILSDLAGKLKKCEPFKPTATSAGVWRMIMNSRRIKLAAAAVIGLAILLPVGYAAVEAVVKYFTISQDRVTFEAREPNYAANFAASRSISIGGTNIATEDEARARLAEFRRLYREGKAKEIQPGVWQVTLGNGELFNYAGDPERVTAEFTPEEKEQMKKEFDELNALQKAGKGERTLIKETEENGVKTRLYEVRYTLSSGKVVTLTEGRSSAGNGGGGQVGLSSQPTAGSGSSEMPEFLKKQMDEIKELRQAGKGERTLLRETEQNGQTLRVYEVRYTLSNGKAVTVTETVNPDGALVGTAMSGSF